MSEPLWDALRELVPALDDCEGVAWCDEWGTVMLAPQAQRALIAALTLCGSCGVPVGVGCGFDCDPDAGVSA